MTRRTTRRRALCAICEVWRLNIKQVFTKLDQETIRKDFLGQSSFDLLAAIKPEIYEENKNLKKLALSLIEPYEMLTNKNMRQKITSVLHPSDAARLANSLDIKNDENVYQKLNNIRIIKNSSSESTLLDFFEVVRPTEFVVVKNPTIESVNPNAGLFDYQRRVVDDAICALDKNPHRVLIHMPTGSGKTRIAMRIISSYLLRHKSTVIVWLAYSEELCEQAIEEFKKVWSGTGNRSVSVYRFFGKYDVDLQKEQQLDGIFVASLKKMDEAGKTRDEGRFLSILANMCTLVVMDEAHQAVAKGYNYILRQLVERHNGVKLIGLTATPGRTWNYPDIDLKLSRFFNKNKVSLNVKDPIKFLVNEEYLSDMSVIKLEHSDIVFTKQELEDIATRKDYPKHIRDKLATDVKRSRKILQMVQELIRKNHSRIIIFASTVEHAKALTAALIYDEINAYCITGSTPNNVRNQYIQKYKLENSDPIVLCNYEVLTAGFDAPKTSVVVIARPTKSLVLYSQMAGRARRGKKAGGNRQSVLVSVIDANLPGFNDFSDAFTNWEDVWN